MIRRIFSVLLLISMALTLFGCSAGKGEYKDQVIYGMDTYITVRCADTTKSGDALSDKYFKEVCDRCTYIVAKNEKLMSAHDEEAQIWGLNHDVDMILSPDKALLTVLRTAENISDLTDSSYLHTIGSLSELWNVTGGGPVPSDEDIAAAMEHISTDSIEVTDEKITKSDSECKIDLGGVAKGYTAQEIVEYLATTDIPYGLVSMGGNIGVFGSKDDNSPFKVGICDPADTDNVAGYLSITSGFIAVSGSYERYFEEDGVTYHHIIDPETGRPADSGIVSVAVWANNGSVADALSTALFVMGEDETLELYRAGKISFEAVLITDDGEVVLTDGICDGEFELESDAYTVRKIGEGDF